MKRTYRAFTSKGPSSQGTAPPANPSRGAGPRPWTPRAGQTRGLKPLARGWPEALDPSHGQTRDLRPLARGRPAAKCHFLAFRAKRRVLELTAIAEDTEPSVPVVR